MAAFISDVSALVIAARRFWDEHNDGSEESRALDAVLEKFSRDVPYDGENFPHVVNRDASPVSDGEWVRVPRVPTQDMCEDATVVRIEDGRGGMTALNWSEAEAVYSAMLAAAPQSAPDEGEANIRVAVWNVARSRGMNDSAAMLWVNDVIAAIAAINGGR